MNQKIKVKCSLQGLPGLEVDLFVIGSLSLFSVNFLFFYQTITL